PTAGSVGASGSLAAHDSTSARWAAGTWGHRIARARPLLSPTVTPEPPPSRGEVLGDDPDGGLHSSEHQGQVHARLVEPAGGGHGGQEGQVDESYPRRLLAHRDLVESGVERLVAEERPGGVRHVSGD